jgi:hypothetical protein
MYEVIVENIGKVYEGTDENFARKTFNDYVKLSKKGYGRAAGEGVILLKDNEILGIGLSVIGQSVIKEHFPPDND